MDVLDLHSVLFSRTAAGERVHERLFVWRKRCGTLARPHILAGRVGDFIAACCGPEHHRIKYRQVAAKCRGSFDLRAAADARSSGDSNLREAWLSDTFHLGQYDADVEFGYSKFLVANCVCIYRAGAGCFDERRSARSSADI